MFAALFASVFEFLLFVGALVIVYQVFLGDWIAAKRAQWREVKGKADSIDKIAQVKLVSGDVKDIEQFVTNNAQYLSLPMVKQLVARIESLQVDQVIATDELLKNRIANLQSEEEEENAETIRPQRTSN